MLDINFFDYLGPVLVEAAKGSPLSESDALAVVERISKSEGQAREQAALEAIAEISARANMPDLGYAVAHKIPITSFGIVSLGFPVAPTLGEMLSLIRRFHRLIAGPLSVDMEIVEGQAVLAMGMQGFAGPGFEQLACGSCLVIDNYIGIYTGKSHNYVKLELTTASQQIASATRKFLGVDPVLSSQRIAAHFPSAYLDLPSPTADPATFQSILTMCEAAEQATGRVMDIPAQVREIVSAHIAFPPSLEKLAERLGMTERQLRFSLTKAGLSYQNLVRDARVIHATGLLKNRDMPISTIAYQLGYTDPANFTAAFRRWTGQSPREMRNNLLEHKHEG